VIAKLLNVSVGPGVQEPLGLRVIKGGKLALGSQISANPVPPETTCKQQDHPVLPTLPTLPIGTNY